MICTTRLFITAFLLQLSTLSAFGQASTSEQAIEECLLHTARVLNEPEARALWNRSLNAPILIIDHLENKLFLTAIEDGRVEPFTEEPWDKRVPLANSFFDYNGKRYVTIVHATLMSLSRERQVNLLAHEIFHTYQKSLGIENITSNNYHMDEVEGRALLRIEMQALQHALGGDTAGLHDALYIRAYRQNLYPDNNEDLYELNEGLAEYTGAKLSAANLREHVKKSLEYDISRGYTNAFGYYTGAAYATVLDELYPQWRSEEELTKGLISLIKSAAPQYTVTLNDRVSSELLAKYDHAQLLATERRELDSFGDIGLFKALLNPGASKLYFPNRCINFTYNPDDRVISLGDAVLLRNITIMGPWGRIDAKSGVVRMNNWSAFYLLAPTHIASNIVQGESYELALAQGWKISEVNGVYTVERE